MNRLPLIILPLFLLAACADSAPQLGAVDAVVVFDYADGSSPPAMRLSVFAEAVSDVRRGSSIRAVHQESGLVWESPGLRTIGGSGGQAWAGYTNFVPASGGAIPEGDYVLYYEDAAGEECEAAFSVSYRGQLAGVPADGLGDALDGDYEELLAVYNAEGLLVYYGPREWADADAVREEFGSRCWTRPCYALDGGGTVCMLPAEGRGDEGFGR